MSDSTSHIESPAEDAAGRFWRLFENDTCPDVDAYLAKIGESNPAVTAAILRIDQRETWRRGKQVFVEDYFARHPVVLTDAEVILDLIFNEYLVREQCGDQPDMEEFLRRFPEHAETLRAQIELHEAVASEPHTQSMSPDDYSFATADPSDAGMRQRVPGYEILGEIGHGGMGVIYQARQTGLNRLVALKMISAGVYASATERGRFRLEAEAIARLRHPNIVQIYDVGTIHNVPYLALEYMDGGSLANALDGKPWPPRAAAELLEVLARTIHAAHEQGIIHRDLKPSNILFSGPDPRSALPKISDFGLAKDLTDGSGQTTSGAIMGTPSYMAPEQAEGSAKHVGPRADVYGLGAILYETITGKPPFQGVTLLETLFQVRTQEPASPSSLQPNLPRDLVTICLKALAKEPERRYASAVELADDLRRFLNDEPIRARSVTRWERGWRWCRRNPVLAGASAAALICFIIAGCFAGVTTLVARERNVAILARTEAEEATLREKEARRELAIRSHIARAAAYRRSGQPGQRFQCIRELKEALRLDPSPENRHEICDEAAAALVLPDVEVAYEWEGFPPGTIAVVFDGDFERYARLSGDGTVTMYRLHEGKAEEVWHWAAPGKAPSGWIWMDPKASCLVIRHGPEIPNSAATLTAWRLNWHETGLVPQKILSKGVTNKYAVLTFQDDGRFLAIADQGPHSVTVINLQSGKDCWKATASGEPRGVAFQPGDDRIAWIENSEVVVHEVATGIELQRLRPIAAKPPAIHNLAWRDHGDRLVAACNDGMIHVWDVANGHEEIPVWIPSLRGDSAITFAPGGERLIQSDLTRTVRLWDARTGRLLMAWPCILSYLARFSNDGRLVGSQIVDTRLRIWRLSAGEEMRVMRHHEENDDPLTGGPVPSADGRLLAARTRTGISFFDLENGSERAWARTPRWGAASMTGYIDHGGWLSFAISQGALYWPVLGSGQAVSVGPPRRLTAEGYLHATVSADGAIMALANGNTAAVKNRKGPIPRRFEWKTQNDVRGTAISPDKRWVATCSWNPDAVSSVQVWDSQTGAHVFSLPVNELGNWAWFSANSRWLVTTSFGSTTRLWKTETWELVRAYREAFVAFSREGEVMALGDEAGVVRLIDPETDREIARLAGPEPVGYDPNFFTLGGTLLVAQARDARALYRWDLRAIRRQLRELDLDWDLPPFPPESPSAPMSRVQVDLGFLTNEAEFPDARAAVAFLSVGLMTQPLSPDAYYHRALALDRLGMREKALADHTVFLRMTGLNDPRRAEVLFRRAEEYFALQDETNAMSDLLEMGSLNLDRFPWPEQASGRCNNLAWSRIVKPGSQPTDDVFRLAQLALRLESSLNSRNTLGVTYYRMGKLGQAVEILEANVDLNPMAAWDLYFLAMCYHRLGEKTSSQRCFEQALRKQAENEPGFRPEDRAELKDIRAEAEQVLRRDEISRDFSKVRKQGP